VGGPATALEYLTVPRVDIADAVEWLRCNTADSLATVIPDADEVDMGVEEWIPWFVTVAHRCFAATNGPVVFVQTDRLWRGQWIDKASLVAEAACGEPLAWHKIALRRGVGATDLHRPTFSHMLAYRGRPGRRTPDVIESGPYLWRNGAGTNVADYIAAWLDANAVRSMLNPFCGHGTLLMAAGRFGIETLGCDLDPERATIARGSQARLWAG
jgi:hypothetical protein